jgi:hypothetical protein
MCFPCHDQGKEFFGKYLARQNIPVFLKQDTLQFWTQCWVWGVHKKAHPVGGGGGTLNTFVSTSRRNKQIRQAAAGRQQRQQRTAAGGRC